MRMSIVIAACACGLLVSGCSPAPYEERMNYLRKVAQQGAETHQLLASQEAKIDMERCKAAYGGLKDLGNRPADLGGGSLSNEWTTQIEQFFVDSCVSGKPKPVPGESTGSTAPNSSGATAPTTTSSTSG
jgi:hypothetical protein